MRDLINNVIQWAEDRNIIEGSTAIKQLDKTSEEFNELQRAVANLAWLPVVADNVSAPYYEVTEKNLKAEVADAYGDILVTLIISAKMLGIDLEDALAQAYEVIRHRKGRLVDGKFLKDES